MSAQDPGDRARWNTELGADPVLATPLHAAQLQHPLLDDRGGPCRCRARARRPIEEAWFALGREAGYPAMGALTRDAQLLGHMGDRSTLSDPLDQNSPAVKMSHEYYGGTRRPPDG